MTDIKSNGVPKKPFFITQFVNTVYGIILGTGVVTSARQLEKWIPSANANTLNIPSATYAAISLLYVVIVVCVYWWDWVGNVGYRAKNTGREFTIDISILLPLECLFFVYEYPPAFSGMFLLLAVMNLCWVYNFRFEEYRTVAQKDTTMDSWFMFLSRNEMARKHIRRRWWGIVIFAIPFLLAIAEEVFHIFPVGWGKTWAWVILSLLIISGFINRHLLYRDRFQE